MRRLTDATVTLQVSMCCVMVLDPRAGVWTQERQTAVSGVGRYANDGRGSNKRNNAKFLRRGFGIKASRNIPACREVLVSYGLTIGDKNVCASLP